MFGLESPLTYTLTCEGMHFITGALFFVAASSAVYWLFSWISTTYGMVGAERLIFWSSLSAGLFASALSHWLADVCGWGF